jgi:hypothetical protein
MPKKRMMQCDTHGSVEWKLHCMCGKCGRVWWINNQPNEAPQICTCGAKLADETALAICPSCYERLYSQQNKGAS